MSIMHKIIINNSHIFQLLRVYFSIMINLELYSNYPEEIKFCKI